MKKKKIKSYLECAIKVSSFSSPFTGILHTYIKDLLGTVNLLSGNHILLHYVSHIYHILESYFIGLSKKTAILFSHSSPVSGRFINTLYPH